MDFVRTLGAGEFVALIKRMFEICLELRIKSKIHGKVVSQFLRMNVKLVKEGNGYLVHFSHCGKWKKEHYERILDAMSQYCAKLILKTENHFLHVEAVHNEDRQWALKRSEGGTNEFPYLKEYLSVKLKPSIIACNLRAFEERLLQEISSFKNLNPEVKFTYFRDSEILYNNRVELDKDYKFCCLVSSAMCKVVQKTLREEFRQECLNLFGVTNLTDLDFAIKSILLPKIHSNFVKMTVQTLRDFEGTEKYF
ncbi:uncharacterized protein LOC117175874 [Belonocnema kinseyi]|uniref:uncharacterized protein LOC117175874 n=1 Tax=Belonocnema kinseyi TaxID=2817044 RepID=UPI00143CF75F|nr:uncharacterized protein LOC117175874 [Belonocnema kinseyi]